MTEDEFRETIEERGYLRVDTRSWTFGRTVIIPVGAINHIGYEERVLPVDISVDGFG